MSKTVIFDMDGVIFDTERLCLASWLSVAEKGMENIEGVFRSCIGTTFEMTRRICLDAYGEDFPYDEFRRRAGEYFYGYEKKYGMPLMPKVREALDMLKANGVKIGLATSTVRTNAVRELEETKLIGYFSSITCGDSVKHSKPAPDIYIEACRAIGEKPEDCFAVEDSINGIISAYDAGLKPIMVPDMLMPDERVEGKTFAVCEDIGKAAELLCSMQ